MAATTAKKTTPRRKVSLGKGSDKIRTLSGYRKANTIYENGREVWSAPERKSAPVKKATTARKPTTTKKPIPKVAPKPTPKVEPKAQPRPIQSRMDAKARRDQLRIQGEAARAERQRTVLGRKAKEAAVRYKPDGDYTENYGF